MRTYCYACYICGIGKHFPYTVNKIEILSYYSKIFQFKDNFIIKYSNVSFWLLLSTVHVHVYVKCETVYYTFVWIYHWIAALNEFKT